MKLSVIVPVYKVEQFLDQCVESVLQLKTDFELILVDDGSPDRCGEICDCWAKKDARIQVIHQENGGLSAARNNGLRKCSGDFVMFLDSDDYLDAQETDKMLENLQDGIDVLTGLYREVYTDSNETFDESSPELLSMHGKVSIETFLNALPMDGNSCAMTAWRFICRRTFLLSNELFFKQGIYHEDEEWNQRLFYATKELHVTHHHFYQYRQARAGSIMATINPKRIRDRFAILKCGADMLEKPDVLLAYERYILQQCAWIYFANIVDYHILNKEEKKQLWNDYVRFKKCSNYLNGKMGKLVSIFQRVFGVRLTCTVFHGLHMIKRVFVK